MFLKPIDEIETIDIGNKCKNKASTDCHDIDMKIVKKVIYGISKSLTHIFNLSSKPVNFQTKWK